MKLIVVQGFTTITSTALLFGKTTLHMPASSLIIVGILTNVSGILGSLAWPRIQAYFQWSNKKVLIVLVMMCSLIPAYGCLGFLPIFNDRSEDELHITKLRLGGLTTPGEMFGLAVYFGTVYGAFQGYARAFYAGLIPPGEEARWYGLYSITDKVRRCAFCSHSLLIHSSQVRFSDLSLSGLYPTSLAIYDFRFSSSSLWYGLLYLSSLPLIQTEGTKTLRNIE